MIPIFELLLSTGITVLFMLLVILFVTSFWRNEENDRTEI